MIALGSDHRGLALRDALAIALVAEGESCGIHGATDESSYDYPDAAVEVAREVVQGNAEYGVLICGTGIGICIAANKMIGIRAALVRTPEDARKAREHGDANILCLGETCHQDLAKKILKVFRTTSLSEDDRHRRRVGKIMEIEKIHLGSTRPCVAEPSIGCSTAQEESLPTSGSNPA